MIEFLKNIFLWLFILFLIAIVGFVICYHVRNYFNNRKHPEHESRIVQMKNGKFQVQCWRHNSSDWYCEDHMGWYVIDNFGFNDKANYDTLDEALKAKEEYDKKAYDWVHKDKVAEVVVGAKE